MMAAPGFVPQADYDELLEKWKRADERAEHWHNEAEQLKVALEKTGLFQKAVDASTQMRLTIPTWQQAREMAMDLLHIKVGNDNVPVVIEYSDGKLNAIRPEE